MAHDEPRADTAVPGVAIVLAGAVAKGAFHAGVLAEIAAREIRVVKVVGTSAGALNGAVFARGVRARAERAAAELLVEQWESRAGLFDVFRFSARDLWSARGLSSMESVSAILREAAGKLVPAGGPVQLEMVVSPLKGAPCEGDAPTSFEHVLRFRDEAFDTTERWAKICQAAVASAAFPGAFAPVEVDGCGPCVDGGSVNNAPIGHAIDEVDVDTVIVVTTQPERHVAPEPLTGLNLVGQVADMLVNERLVRDLKEAARVNEKLLKIRALVEQGALTEAQAEQVREALGWRPIGLVPVRPPPHRPLRGGPFSAFGDVSLRREYIAAGREAARAALDALDVRAARATRR